jgi:hypothetical protein
MKLTIMSVLAGSALLLVFVAFAVTSVLSRSDDARQQRRWPRDRPQQQERLAVCRPPAGQHWPRSRSTTTSCKPPCTTATASCWRATVAAPAGRAGRADELPAPQADDAPRSERSGLPWAPALRVYRVLRSGDEAPAW